MKIQFSQMKGMIPVLDDNLLPEGFASRTLNCRPEGDGVVPFKLPVEAGFSIAAGVKSWSLYHYDKTETLSRTDNADFLRGPIANDAYNRMYAAGDSEKPQVYYSVGGSSPLFADLAIKVPNTPSVSSSWNNADPGDPSIPVYNSVYYVTGVTILGEESAPSDVTQVIQRWDTALVPVSLGSNNDSRVVKRRLYRSDAGGDFQLVLEAVAGINTINDGKDTAQLGYVCESENFNAPPDNLEGLVNAGNGYMASWFENTVCFCEPYYPHAWPIDYQYSIPATVKGMAATQGALIVTTDSQPYVFQGTHPGGISILKLDLRAPNLSRRGIVDMGETAFYPSTEGLVAIGAGGANVITREIFSKEQWLALDPASFVAFRYRSFYLCFASTGAFAFDPAKGYWPLEITGVDGDQVLDGHYDDETDTLYLLVKSGDDSLTVFEFDSGSNMQMLWESREHVRPGRAVISSGRLDSEAEAALTLVGSHRGSEVYSSSHTTSTDEGFRFSPGFYSRFKVRLESEDRINSAAIASTKAELL